MPPVICCVSTLSGWAYTDFTISHYCSTVTTVSKFPRAATPLRHLACDGKELRGSYRLTGHGVQAAQGVLGIYDTASDRMAALLPIEGKGFEPKALRAWLAEQASKEGLAGCLLTADALHTQSAVCKAIRTAGADYLLVAKRNQRSLREDIGYLFSQAPDFWFPERRTSWCSVGHGRIEIMHAARQ